ncbi:MAG: D-alanyl-D-alanine carboxypeptidase family protein [Candidatus Binataceae bacterium]
MTLVTAASLLIVATFAQAAVHESIVIDAASGRVLESHNATAQTYPASLTKLMTLYLVFGALDSGKLTLNKELPVSAHAAAQPPTRLGLHRGETIAVESAILAIVTKSANDAAVVLGEALGGSEDHFAGMMTQEARQLGMTQTVFRNASGLPDPEERTSARDMATLALALIADYPQDYHFFSVRSFIFHGRVIAGHDHLLGEFPGADGLKTGYTHAAGYNLVTSAIRSGRRLIGVVMGGPTFRARDQRMIALLTDGFAHETAKMEMAKAAPADADGDGPAPIEPVTEKPSTVMKTTHDAEVRDAAAATVAATEMRPDRRSWRVEVGALYRHRHTAWGALLSALHTFPRKLHGIESAIVRVHEGRSRGYRVELTGLTRASARDTCAAFRHKQFVCRIVGPASRDSVLEAKAH